MRVSVIHQNNACQLLSFSGIEHGLHKFIFRLSHMSPFFVLFVFSWRSPIECFYSSSTMVRSAFSTVRIGISSSISTASKRKSASTQQHQLKNPPLRRIQKIPQIPGTDQALNIRTDFTRSCHATGCQFDLFQIQVCSKGRILIRGKDPGIYD